MRSQGKITYWKGEKGYGFITPDSGAKQVFVHVSAFKSRNKQPKVNQLVSFDLATDRQGRPCAARVVAAGEKIPGEIKRNDKNLWAAGAVLYLLVVGLTVLAGYIPIWVFLVYIVASLLTYAFYKVDKSAASKSAWRVQESTLHFLALLGGWPGAIIAQQFLRHKTRKEEFRFVFWLTVLLNSGFYAWLFTSSGTAFLMALKDAVVG